MRARTKRSRSWMPWILAVVAIGPAFACSKKLDQEACDHLLGRGVGLAAYSGSAEVPIDIEALKKRARGDARKAVDDFGKACLGAKDDGIIACARRANDSGQFVACGDLTKKAREAGDALKWTIARNHDSNECAQYSDHGVKIGVVTVDEVRDLVQECDGVMEEGVFKCRLDAKDKAAWEKCDAP